METIEQRCQFNETVLRKPTKCTDAHLGFNYEVKVTLGSRERCEELKFLRLIKSTLSLYPSINTGRHAVIQQ